MGVCREQRPLCCWQGHGTASTAEGRRPVPHPGSLCALGVGSGLRAPGSRLRAPAEKPAQEPHFWSLALRALGANTGPSSDPSLVKVGFGWPRLFQCFVSNN